MINEISGIELEKLFNTLNTKQDVGLNGTVAKERLSLQNKSIKTPSKFERNFKLLIRQYTNPLVLLLVGAVLLSAFLGQATDTIIISFILLATGLLSFWQELNAGKAVEQLQKMIQLNCDVIRDGKEIEINTTDVVPGDIILFRAGDIIPADCRLISGTELHINESSITGESYPVEKTQGIVPDDKPTSEKNNCLWRGTNVVSGTGKAIVVFTGTDTIFGQMAHSLTRNEESAFEKGIKHFGFFLMQVTIVLCVIILCVNFYFKKPIFDSILFSLAIAVGMAPELLPAIMTFAMSVGAKKMLAKKVIVKKLSSIFNFGEVNVLCTDKTGTITDGIIKVKSIIDIYGVPNAMAKQFAFLNSYFQKGFTNPIDDALKQIDEKADGYEKLDELPYDFIRKRLSIAVIKDSKKYLITKGAVTNILEVCTKTIDEKGNITELKPHVEAAMQQFTNCSNDGLRAIGIAYKEIKDNTITRESENEMIFLGFILLEDPLKEGIIDTLDKLRKLEVTVKIITGDNQYVAAYNAKKIGIKNPVILTGKDIKNMLPEALKVKANHTDVFAEVEPNQKELIIKALQKSKYVVAYMGDGINDVAAIHAADVGISTNNAVDVAKQAADFVLLEKDLSVLADGIYEGRKTFVNTLKYIFINTGATFGNMFSVAGSSMLLPFLPMLPKQILLTNFLTDFPFMAVASDNVDEERLMKPGKWNLPFIRKFMILFGLHSSLFDFATFFFQKDFLHLSPIAFQTGWFIESCLTQLVILFIIRTTKPFFKSKPGKWLTIISILAALVVAVLPFSPFAHSLGLEIANTMQAIGILIIVLVYALTADLLKYFVFKNQKEI